jgi:dihydroorotase, multifunctional complex type
MIIKNGYLMDPATGFEGYYDIEIRAGKIYRIGENLTAKTEIIDASNCVVAPGLIDVHVHFRDPGLTYKEDIHSGAKAAAKGGFTTVICMANTKPAVDNVETLKYILEEGKKTSINILAVASISEDLKGQKLVDMKELHKNGACGFSDDGFPLMDAQMVIKAMEEAKNLNVPISFHEEDPAFIINSGVNQGEISAVLGIGGAAAIAEDIMVARDCMLALHTGACINIQHISSKNSVELVRSAKKLGANIIAEATPHHFTLTEDAVLEHGTLAKMNPPLRTQEDKEAIIQGLKDGTIEIIATDHAPHSEEEKNREFLQAPSGITGLETSLTLGITYLVREGHLTLMELMKKMSYNPSKLYHLPAGKIAEQESADLVIFNKDEEWIVKKDFASKACNTPFIGRKMFGRVKYTICNGEKVYEDFTS